MQVVWDGDRMKKFRRYTSIGIVIIAVIMFFYQTWGFWFAHPEMSQMQVFLHQWRWVALFVGLDIVAGAVAPRGGEDDK